MEKRLQVEEVKKATAELEELTNIFVGWGNDLNGGQQVTETLSAYELGKITRSSAEVVGKVPYDAKNAAYDSIQDEFSLSEFFESLIRKHQK